MSHIHIEVKDLTFAYEKDRKILDGVTFTAREQDAIGIIGANGAGKSTLLKILVGLLLSFEGTVRVEEIPLEKRTLPRIREKIGYVFQSAFFHQRLRRHRLRPQELRTAGGGSGPEGPPGP